MAFSPNLQITEPTPFDPAQTNEWATTVNNNMAIIDIAVGGTLTLSVAGDSNAVLTSTAGATSQSLYGNYVFTGALTGNIIIFWPNGVGRKFSVSNETTGGFTVTLAVNNGSGSPAGTTVVAPADSLPRSFYSDGTNAVEIGVTSYSGAWVPFDQSGSSLSFTDVSGGYTVIGNMVFAYGTVTYPTNSDGAGAVIGGLPFACANQPYAFGNFTAVSNSVSRASLIAYALINTTLMNLLDETTDNSVLNSILSGAVVRFSIAYPLT